MKTVEVLVAVMLVCGSAGAQWTIQDSHTTASLRGVDSLGNGVVWASGTGGTVLRTEDGGKNWQRCKTPPGAEKLDFRGVQGMDSKTAVVTGSEIPSKFMRSEFFDSESEVRVEELKKNPMIAFEHEFLRWMLSDGAGALYLSNQVLPGGYWAVVRVAPSVESKWSTRKSRVEVAGDATHLSLDLIAN